MSNIRVMRPPSKEHPDGLDIVRVMTDQEEIEKDAIQSQYTSAEHNPITLQQLRLAMLKYGQGASFVQDKIKEVTEPNARATLQIWFDETTALNWSSSGLQLFFKVAGINEADARDLWEAARKIEV